MAAVPIQQKTTVPLPKTPAGSFTASTERRQAALLCAEVRGLARLSEALDPGLVMVLASEFFNLAAEATAVHGGEAIDAQHDRLVSVFTRGNPSQISQQAVRAA